MYPITPAVKDLFRANTKQIARIRFAGVESSILITDDDIVQGGLSVNRYCASGSSIEIGSAVAAEMSLKLNNFTGRFNTVVFGGAELFVEIGVSAGAYTYYVPLGYFTVDKTPKITDTIELKALDRMVLFDKVMPRGSLPYPCSLSVLLSHICTVCNVPLETDIITAAYPNASYMVTSDPVGDDTTYRQVLSWICELTGTCAYIDWNGKLRLEWYSSTGEEIGTDIRYSSEIETNDITITGVQITNKDTFYVAGEAGYIINIEGNGLVQGSEETLVNNLYAVLGNFSYTPASASIEPSPYLYPLDMYTFIDRDDNEHTAIITDVTFALNKNTDIKGRGETETEKSYATQNPLTKREQILLEALAAQQNEMLNSRFGTLLQLNELMSNATGLYQTSEVQSDGSSKLYLHDAPVLRESTVIFTMTSAGIAWSNDGWHDDPNLWHSGVTAAGDAFFRLISAEGINVSKINEDYHIEITPSAFQIYFRDMMVMKIEKESMSIPRVTATDYIQVGRVRMIPHDPVGADFIFVD